MLTRYRKVTKGGRGRILDELCALTGWHRATSGLDRDVWIRAVEKRR